jgi:transposase InsO family protein
LNAEEIDEVATMLNDRPRRPSDGILPLKPSTSTYRFTNRPVLRRSIEPSQYLAIRYSERLAEAGVVHSVGSKGDSYVNALSEGFNGLHKTELIHCRGP